MMAIVYVSNEAKKRLKKFSEKYNMSISSTIDWIVFSMIDENGDPKDRLKEVVDSLGLYEKYTLDYLSECSGVCKKKLLRVLHSMFKNKRNSLRALKKNDINNKQYYLPRPIAEELLRRVGMDKEEIENILSRRSDHECM